MITRLEKQNSTIQYKHINNKQLGGQSKYHNEQEMKFW